MTAASSIISMLNSPIATMAMVFGSVQLLRFVDMTSPKTIILLRCGYIISQMLMLTFWTIMRSKVMASKSKETVQVEEPANPLSGEPAKITKMPLVDYDLAEVRKQLQQIFVGFVIMMVLHFWLGLVQPLFMQMILPWKTAITQPIVQIYLFGFGAKGDLQRPFKQPNPFAAFLGDQGTETNADSTAEGSNEPRIQEVIEEDEHTKTSNKVKSRKNNKKKSSRKED